MPRQWLVAAVLVLAAACTTDDTRPSARYDKDNIGYETNRDASMPGRYFASGVYIDGQGVKADVVRLQALLNGVEAARKDGYDLVAWNGPEAMGATQRLEYQSRTQASPSFSRDKKFLGYSYAIQGYRSRGEHPAGAHPIVAVINQVKIELAQQK